MWFLFGEVSSRLPLGAWDGLRYFIVALTVPSILLFCIPTINEKTIAARLFLGATEESFNPLNVLC